MVEALRRCPLRGAAWQTNCHPRQKARRHGPAHETRYDLQRLPRLSGSQAVRALRYPHYARRAGIKWDRILPFQHHGTVLFRWFLQVTLLALNARNAEAL
ncbi:hypothetical protein PsYK624_077480 [Phanerochaete sordida]|uniref:Uncharacterized protein n=1 Tax=Phanerochaete sordida TaxID=48140 RepID=A0A9P3GB09_9APHY|nr:hypothetical protein PsYK624_077480 [Phanerochaete sordida]